jgi:hypothetical protein
MNERIVKLISEADAYASTIVDKYTPDNGQVSYLWEDAFRKKFAELIVRECMSFQDEAGVYSRYDMADAIKRHFGV